MKTIRIIVFVLLSLTVVKVAYHLVEIGQRIEEFSAQAQNDFELAVTYGETDPAGAFYAATAAHATVQVVRAEQEERVVINSVLFFVPAGLMLFSRSEDRRTL